eukprot:398160_1
MEKQNNNMYTIKCMYKEPSSICILNTSRFTYIDCATFEITTKIFNVQRFKSEEDYNVVLKLLFSINPPTYEYPLQVTENQRAGVRWTPLLFAAKHGSLECSKIFIEMGVDVNFQNMNGETALMLSSQNGHTEVVELLLSHNVGADANVTDKNDRTALFHAVTSGSIECVKILLSSNKININHQDQFEINILMLALSIREACADIRNTYAEFLKLLLDYDDANVILNSFCDTDDTDEVIWAGKNNQMECVEVLLSHGVDINAKDEYELTALMHAVCHGTVNSAELLFKYNPDINIVNKFGQTALIMASWKGKIECVQLLLKYDANNINLTDSIKLNEDSALICASKEGHIECVKELLLYNANINASNKYGGTALIYASKEGH